MQVGLAILESIKACFCLKTGEEYFSFPETYGLILYDAYTNPSNSQPHHKPRENLDSLKRLSLEPFPSDYGIPQDVIDQLVTMLLFVPKSKQELDQHFIWCTSDSLFDTHTLWR
jgi:hypothetical protein